MQDGQGSQPMQQPPLNWSLAQDITCEECGHNIFISGVYLQKLSKLIAATDKDLMRPIPTFCCAKCGHVNKEFAMKSK